ncbi:Bug family tripartite tricarboxylate transporter substrate binding protein [Variovorax sp. CY25R-8]|uniref:Bug family tripartite tricarboxylate transporter substrate binding protein n=1 Tax=Variovorax sp. CY25R-8 TaxID=2855501 RepID=UPI0021BA6E07|nr:tripartite tricarboxylate transporter substrate binding protein [Variovorax sp. CY25R-8]MCT8179240.1 tripartite tricarboxylate transporter substrate binding protein [Variovorax sp. CY25R-8]
MKKLSMYSRRSLIERSLALGLSGLAGGAARAASAWPSKPIQVIVPATTASAPEIVARMLAEALSARLSSPVYVEGMPGASGIIGTDKALKAPADGHTLLYAMNQVATMNPHLYPRLPYNPARDMAPISLVARGGYVLLAYSGLPAPDLPSLIALAKREPGKLAYASTGNGSAFHLGMELIKLRCGIDLLHVPYRSGANANTELMAGRVQVRLEPQASALALIRGGRVKALAVTTRQRLPALPQVPTVQDTLPGFELSGWNALWAPAGTPAPVIERLHAEVQAVLGSDAFRRHLLDLGLAPEGSTPGELAALTARETAQWKALIEKTGIKAD